MIQKKKWLKLNLNLKKIKNFKEIKTFNKEKGLFFFYTFELVSKENGYLTEFEYSAFIKNMKRTLRLFFFSKINCSLSLLMSSLSNLKSFTREYTTKNENSRMGKGIGIKRMLVIPISQNYIFLKSYTMDKESAALSIQLFKKIQTKLRISIKIIY